MAVDGASQARSSGTSEPRRNEQEDLYELLEISPRASYEVIHAAYRVLARAYHPDVNASDAAAHRIRRLNAAYHVLSDPEGRARYDLECSRAHRFERLNHNDSAPSSTRRVASRAESGNVRRTTVIAPIDDKRLALHGQVLLGLLFVAAVSIILFAMVWAGMEIGEASDIPAWSVPPAVDFPRR
jgi:curved DNA-binding protein CbpA